MKKIYIIQLFLLTGVLIFFSCKEEIEIATPEFEVNTDAKTFKVNQEVKFNIKGNPDFISFYSGEIGHNYTFKGGRVVEKGAVKLSFNSNVQYGNQANMFAVLVSTNFNGNYSDISQVNAAAWTDITNRFTLSTNTTFTNSGSGDISDVVEDGKPLYVAFKLTVRDADMYGTWRVWRVQAYQLTTQTSIGILPLGDMLSPGFVIVEKDLSPAIKTRSSATTGTISMYPAVVTPENKNVSTEVWAISGPVQAGKFNAGPDRPVPIKGSITGYTREYKYTFSSPGTYKVHFVASNNNIYGAKEVVREMELNIVP